ncbi:MAG TPA: hypothetical protein VG737_03555 [Cyclobacteriaceae bacterium]|nr:hypothetical protein [Cyclobacteriaceae bacterium]
MKISFILLVATFAAANVLAQESRGSKSTDGLVLITSARSGRQHHFVNRMDYWTSQYDRYWSKWEKFASKEFVEKISRSTRNLSRISNGRRVDRYPMRNKSELKRKEGLIKIN